MNGPDGANDSSSSESHRDSQKIQLKKQISTLLYCLGEEAESVLSSADTTADDRKDYKKITDKLDEFFKVRHNVIYERARFNRRSQQPRGGARNFRVVRLTFDLVSSYVHL